MDPSLAHATGHIDIRMGLKKKKALRGYNFHEIMQNAPLYS